MGGALALSVTEKTQIRPRIRLPLVLEEPDRAARFRIGTDSVHFPSTSEAFRAAEAKAIGQDKRMAQALVAKNDCAGLRWFQVQISASRTTAVSRAVEAVAAKCVDQPGSPPTGPAAAFAEARPATPADLQMPSCEIPDVDDAMLQAANQFSAGFAKAALSLVVKALGCRQNERMYRSAVTYACAAHDVAAAKAYYDKGSAQFQPALIQRCQQENITIP